MSEKRTFGWKRLWQPPRAAFKGGSLTTRTPRGEWLYQRSRLRAMDNPDIYIAPPAQFEIGSWSSFRFIETLA